MKRRFYGMLCMLFALSLCGCGQKDLGDSYVEGSDCQYMFDSQLNVGQTTARGENGYFFSQGHYIYYLDDETQQLVALCNKADCLHDAETDEDRFADCNAYLENEFGDDESIYYCNGYLYVLDKTLVSNHAASHHVLYRITEDGSKRETVYTWDSDGVEHWCVHRDVMYYIEHTYYTDEDGEAQERYEVKELSLNGLGTKTPETIYTAPEDKTEYGFGDLQAYGNYIYFDFNGASVTDTSDITDENYSDYMYCKQYAYQIQTGELIEIEPSSENKIIQGVTFWQGRIVYDESDYDMELGEMQPAYIADLDGSNREVLFDAVEKGIYYYSDGKYLYLTNCALVFRGVEDTQYYKVYDADLNLVDTFTLPFKGEAFLAVGSEDKMYIWASEGSQSEMTLECFDKSQIGSLDGAEISYSEAASWLKPGYGSSYFFGEDLFGNVEADQVEQITYYPSEEEQIELTDEEAIAEIVNLLLESAYSVVPDGITMVQDTYAFELLMENGEIVAFALDDSVLELGETQYSCEDTMDVEETILQYFE